MSAQANTRDGFLEQLVPFSDFDGITREANFTRVPDDWIVVITDVKGSTRAIEEGRYRDVNTLGAASISVVQNALPDLEFPFVFGGDGATLVVPPSSRAVVEDALARLKRLARDRFDIELRAGSCPVEEVLAAGWTIEVGRLQLVPEKAIAVFRGGGLSWAEDQIKAPGSKFEIEGRPTGPVELDGLSCRWQPIPHKRGNIVSLLVTARGDEKDAIYERLLARINGLFDGGLAKANPVDPQRLAFRSLRECFANERRYHSSLWTFSFFLRSVEIVLAVLLYRVKAAALLPAARRYREAMGGHSDYRKFDDTLRMVIDCSNQQRADLDALLEESHRRGEIFYGVHRTDHALMTCYLRGMSDGEHLHFVDGGDGGYAMAAKQLKGQQIRT